MMLSHEIFDCVRGRCWIAPLGGLLAVAFVSCEPAPEPEQKCSAYRFCGDLDQVYPTVTNDPRIDGVFAAVVTLARNLDLMRWRLDSDVRALAIAYGVETRGRSFGQVAIDLVPVIELDVARYSATGLLVRASRPLCRAGRGAAIEAQAMCEARSNCDVEVFLESGTCEGLCDGACDGSCSGEFACRVSVADQPCGGRCQGVCIPAQPEVCDGECLGTCSGSCSAYDVDGDCRGICDGECDGMCNGAPDGACSGSCTGVCLVAETDPRCTNESTCAGTCDGLCLGACRGILTPAPTSVDCEASAECLPQARARGSANVTCEFAQLELALDAGVQADPAFYARLSTLERRGASILTDHALMLALAGDFGVDALVTEAPFLVVEGELDRLPMLELNPYTCADDVYVGTLESQRILEETRLSATDVGFVQALLRDALLTGF